MSLVRELLHRKAGNIALTFALIVPVLIGGIGVSLDYAMLVDKRRVIQSSMDAASLAGVAALASRDKTTTTVVPYAQAFLAASLGSRLTASEISALAATTTVTPTQTTVGNKKIYTVAMKGTLSGKLLPFSGLLGFTNASVTTASKTSSAIISKALSVDLVVDRSGSMSWVTDTTLASPSKCQNYTQSNWGSYPNLKTSSPCYLNKMGSLKNAASGLFDTLDQLEAQDTSNTLIRSGVVSFNDAQQTPSAIAWGTTDSRTYVTNIPGYPTGGTDMSGAMDTAYKTLSASAEDTAQASKNNTLVAKYIILMTDGENTGSTGVWQPALDDKTLQACSSARTAGITIYTVAYMAPTAGKSLLLKCAGTSGNAFEAENAADLVAIFKAIGDQISDRTTVITG